MFNSEWVIQSYLEIVRSVDKENQTMVWKLPRDNKKASSCISQSAIWKKVDNLGLIVR